MSTESSRLEAEYQARIDAMSPTERVARSLAMFQWFREMIGRQIRGELTAEGVVVSDEELQLRVALRIYGDEPAVVAMIQQRLNDVSNRSISQHD